MSDVLVATMGAWLIDQWRWDAFFTGTFRPRPRPAVVYRAPQVQHGWRRLPKSLSRGQWAEPYVGPGFAFSQWQKFIRWIQEREPTCRPWWVLAIESQRWRSDYGAHIHAIIGGVPTVRRTSLWEHWFSRHGMARALSADPQSAMYVAKYVSKEGRLFFSDNLNESRMVQPSALRL